MTRYVLTIDIVWKQDQTEDSLEVELDNEDEAVKKYKELTEAFNEADEETLKDFFGHELYEYYFRSSPKLFKEEYNRYKYSI